MVGKGAGNIIFRHDAEQFLAAGTRFGDQQMAKLVPAHSQSRRRNRGLQQKSSRLRRHPFLDKHVPAAPWQSNRELSSLRIIGRLEWNCSGDLAAPESWKSVMLKPIP